MFTTRAFVLSRTLRSVQVPRMDLLSMFSGPPSKNTGYWTPKPSTITRGPQPEAGSDASGSSNLATSTPDGTGGSQDKTMNLPAYERPNELAARVSSLQHSSKAQLLLHPSLAVQRDLELGQLLLGYEQMNKYKIMDPGGSVVGYIMEDGGIGRAISRQILRTHRPMTAIILDAQTKPLYKIERPFYWIQSSMWIHDADTEKALGEVHRNFSWKFRRCYDLYENKSQFGVIDAPILSLDFDVSNQSGSSISRIFNDTGFFKFVITDANSYGIQFDESDGELSLEQRAVLLSTAVSIDFDYFSRHGGMLPVPLGTSSGTPVPAPAPGPGGGPVPVPLPMGGLGEDGEPLPGTTGDSSDVGSAGSAGSTGIDGTGGSSGSSGSSGSASDSGFADAPPDFVEDEPSGGFGGFGGFGGSGDSSDGGGGDDSGGWSVSDIMSLFNDDDD